MRFAPWRPIQSRRMGIGKQRSGVAAAALSLAAGIALAIVTVVNSTGSALLNNKFNSVNSAMK